jgi:hypothetical protein
MPPGRPSSPPPPRQRPQVYPGFPGNATVLEQCLAEQRYVRGAQLRSLLYSQVGRGRFGGGMEPAPTPVLG